MLVFVWYAIPYVHSSFAIIFTRKRELIALLLLSLECLVTVNVLWLFLAVPWVSLQYVIVIFPNHTHLLLYELSNVILKQTSNVQKGYYQAQKIASKRVSARDFVPFSRGRISAPFPIKNSRPFSQFHVCFPQFNRKVKKII